MESVLNTTGRATLTELGQAFGLTYQAISIALASEQSWRYPKSRCYDVHTAALAAVTYCKKREQAAISGSRRNATRARMWQERAADITKRYLIDEDAICEVKV